MASLPNCALQARSASASHSQICVYSDKEWRARPSLIPVPVPRARRPAALLRAERVAQLLRSVRTKCDAMQPGVTHIGAAS